jgi:hypothetical protein
MARHAAGAGLHVQPFDDDTGACMLLKLLDLDHELASNQENATSITRTLGGLPLAINQIGSFVSQRKLPLIDFIPLY